MPYAHEYLTHSRQQELVREAQRARLVRCLRSARRRRDRPRRPCA